MCYYKLILKESFCGSLNEERKCHAVRHNVVHRKMRATCQDDTGLPCDLAVIQPLPLGQCGLSLLRIAPGRDSVGTVVNIQDP
jgi:hypothetical protein